MALWGTADSLYSVGTISVNYANKTVAGSGTSFTAAGISTGDLITIGAGGTFGSAVISKVNSNTSISIATTQYLTGQPISGVVYSISEKPIYTLEDSNYSSNVVGVTTTIPKHNVYGVDEYEIDAIGISTKYGGIHAGWVGIHTYIDMHGNLRVKSETLVAMSEISSGSVSYSAPGDASDDTVFPDNLITISSQPVGVSTTSGGTAVFGVTASATPSASLSYQWQQSTGGAYSNLSNGGQINGATSNTLTIVNNNNSRNGYKYQVVITTSGGASRTSNSATLTIV